MHFLPLRRIFIAMLFLAAGMGYAQISFEGGVVLGANLSQIDGDAYSGYRRLGAEFGLKSVVRFGERFYCSAQWLYSQRGSRASTREELRDFGNAINIGIDYLELPILFHLAPGDKRGTRYPLEVFTGFSVARLIRSNVREIGDNVRFYPYLLLGEVKDDFTSFDISHLVGIQYNFTVNVAFYLKHTISLRDLYKPVSGNDSYNQLEPYYLTMGANYIWRNE